MEIEHTDNDDNVVMIHMRTGANVIARIALLFDEDDDHEDIPDEDKTPIGIRAFRPYTFGIVMTPQGPQPQFLPFLSLGGLFPALDHLDLMQDDFWLFRQVPKQMLADYLTHSSPSGIQVQSKPSIILS